MNQQKMKVHHIVLKIIYYCYYLSLVNWYLVRSVRINERNSFVPVADEVRQSGLEAGIFKDVINKKRNMPIGCLVGSHQAYVVEKANYRTMQNQTEKLSKKTVQHKLTAHSVSRV